MASQQELPASRTCFVTIGATAAFSDLIRAALAPSFCTALDNKGYTHLIIQYGRDGKSLFDECLAQKPPSMGQSLKISGFDLDRSGLTQYMLRCRLNPKNGLKEGVVISHAGSGTVLDALRVSVPLIVIPNSTLLDNHQVELAEVLAEQEYVVHGKLEKLPGALLEAEKLAMRTRQWPPVNSGTHRRAPGFAGVLDEELGHLD